MSKQISMVAMIVGWLALLAMAQTTTINVPQPSTITITVTPTSQPAPPVVTPPVATPPVVVAPPPVVVAPPTQSPISRVISTNAAGGASGSSLATTQWLETFSFDANGFIDLMPLMPSNFVSMSAAGMTGHLATDSPDLTGAIAAANANGSYCIALYDGDTYPLTMMDNNIDGAPGTIAHPWIITRVNPVTRKFSDHSLPRPIVCGGFGQAGSAAGGHAWGGPFSGLIIDGLDFYADQRDPASKTYVKGTSNQDWAFSSGAPAGTSCDHVLIADCRIRYFQGGVSIVNGTNSTFATMVLYRDVVANTYGGATQPGAFISGTQDFLAFGCTFAGCGWNPTAQPKSNTLGMQHDFYDSLSSQTGDPQHRFIDCTFATAAADGLEGNAGGVVEHCLFLANPIGGYVGGGYPGIIQNSACDGGGGEFDNGVAGSALNLVSPPTFASSRGYGLYLDYANPGGIYNVAIINKADAGDTNWNYGFAAGVHTADSGKGFSGACTSTLSGITVSGWSEWQNGSVAATFNPLNLSQNGPPLATINITGNCYLPGVTGLANLSGPAPLGLGAVTGIANVIGTTPNYVDPTRTCSTYAKSLGIAGVNNGPTLLNAMENQTDGNWNSALEPGAIVDWILAGYEVQQ